MKKIARSELNALFAAISAQKQLYIPADTKAGQAQFTLWQDGIVLTDKLNTVRSAKDLFFPQVEQIVNFKVTGKTMEIIENRDVSEPFVVFGVRACDCRSFDILDTVFLADPVDTFYQTRRENGLVITMACSRPEETCFCGAFGIDAANPAGDITCWMDENALYWRANTQKGEELTATLSILVDCDNTAVASMQEKTREILKKLPLNDLDLSNFDSKKLLEYFNADVWTELSESCLGCGTCTFVCPTCQCYDVQDFDNGREVRRFRCWDSCMYSDFTMMAHGTNRPTQKERFRQRFMHKLVYYPSNNGGVFGCVGCGRCLQKCPIHMNIVKVAKKLKEAVK
ncbi:MAG: 4Fe-4S dicluster domain-containing protein [Oscillospiraceae bacterium]|nr:4Fe-4S dicluster domain-containing protein [Oscillospiraceae bacterium]